MNIKEEEILTKLDKNIRAIKELLIVAILLSGLLLMDLFFFNGQYVVISKNRNMQQAHQSQVASNNIVEQPVMSENNDNSSNNDKMASTQQLSVVFENKKGVKLNAEFNNGQAIIESKRLGISVITLSQSVSASGARYIDDKGIYEFWNKGDEVTLRENGETIFLGKEVK